MQGPPVTGLNNRLRTVSDSLGATCREGIRGATPRLLSTPLRFLSVTEDGVVATAVALPPAAFEEVDCAEVFLFDAPGRCAARGAVWPASGRTRILFKEAFKS